MRALFPPGPLHPINCPLVLELLTWRAEHVAGHAYENNISGITSDTTSCTSETGNANLGPYRSRLGGVCVVRHEGLELLIRSESGEAVSHLAQDTGGNTNVQTTDTFINECVAQ